MKLLASIVLGAFCACAGAQTFEQKVVAAVLMGEAWDQGKAGMSAVAEVIHQRGVETGQTPLQVVTQGKLRHRAFSCMNGYSATGLVRKFSGQADFQTALRLAMQTQFGHATRYATHFTRKEEKPWWAKGYKPVVIIGDHAFYRLPWLL